jgi:hypothetical protein
MFNPTRDLLINPTLWFCVLCFVGLLWRYAKERGAPGGAIRTRDNLHDIISRRSVVAAISIPSIGLIGCALYLSYVAPLDVMQDLVSAEQMIHGESAYPDNMSRLIDAALKKEPPAFSLGRWFPRIRDKEAWESRGLLPYQAHPPLLPIIDLPFVEAFGIHGASLLVNLLSLAALGLTLMLVYVGCEFNLSPRARFQLAAAISCWYPVLLLLRQGQSGLLIEGLVVLGWFLLRQGRIGWAGIPIGAATCLKLYPGLLLVYLLLRHRRALATALTTIGVLIALPALWLGWHVYSEYLQMAGKVLNIYGSSPDSLSLLAGLLKNGIHVSSPVFACLGALITGICSWLIWRKSDRPVGRTLDIEYSLFTVLMVLLSPIAWAHYLVILILPFAVLGERALRRELTWPNMIGFMALVIALTIPIDFLVFPFQVKRRPESVHAHLASITTIAVGVLAIWIARLQTTRAKVSPQS